MRVVHVTTSDSSLRYLLFDQIRFLQDHGHDVSAISGRGPYVEWLRDAGIPVVTVPLTRRITPVTDVRTFGALVAAYVRLRPDVVHTHTPKAGILGQWSALLARVPHRVHTIHGLYFPGHMRPGTRWRYAWLERAQMAPAELVLSQNAEDIETCERERLCDARRLRFLGNGIDVERFHPRNRAPERVVAVRSALGIPPGHLVIGMVGRMTAEKGYRDFFGAARILAARGDVTFIAVGAFEPWKADAIGRPEIDALGLGDRLRVLGQRDDVDDLYAAMDVLALPSHREGFPRAPMEAAATGLPVVVSDERGCRATVIDGESGLLVPMRDAEALARALGRLLDDPLARERMGARGRRLAEERFDQRIVFQRVLDAYAELR